MTPDRPHYQYHYEEKEITNIVRFPAKTVIYINGYQTAVLKTDCFAERLNSKRRGPYEYVARSRLDLYFNTRFWSEGEGTMFTAYAKKARKIRK